MEIFNRTLFEKENKKPNPGLWKVTTERDLDDYYKGYYHKPSLSIRSGPGGIRDIDVHFLDRGMLHVLFDLPTAAGSRETYILQFTKPIPTEKEIKLTADSKPLVKLNRFKSQKPYYTEGQVDGAGPIMKALAEAFWQLGVHADELHKKIAEPQSYPRSEGVETTPAQLRNIAIAIHHAAAKYE